MVLVCLHTNMRKLTQDEIISQFNSVHCNKYDYSKFIYVNEGTKGVIICPTHGEFEQIPRSHKRGHGCTKCKSRKISRSEVIESFKLQHGNLYDYSKFEYKGNHIKGTIICKIHGEFLQSPRHHKDGRGCPLCGKVYGGYDTMSKSTRMSIKDVWLYHIELSSNEEYFHKIGITGNLKSRFAIIESESNYKITNGYIKLYPNAQKAFELEQRLLDHIKIDLDKSYTPNQHFRGKTECFTPISNNIPWNLDLSNIPKQSNNFKFISK